MINMHKKNDSVMPWLFAGMGCALTLYTALPIKKMLSSMPIASGVKKIMGMKGNAVDYNFADTVEKKIKKAVKKTNNGDDKKLLITDISRLKNELDKLRNELELTLIELREA